MEEDCVPHPVMVTLTAPTMRSAVAMAVDITVRLHIQLSRVNVPNRRTLQNVLKAVSMMASVLRHRSVAQPPVAMHAVKQRKEMVREVVTQVFM